MLVKTQGIILHTLRYNDQNLIVKILTRHFGLQSYLVRSSRKSKNTALFQPLNILLLETRWQENKNLQRVKECTVAYQYIRLPFHPERRAIAMMMNEFMMKCLPDGNANEELFEFMMQALISLDNLDKTDANFHLKFTIDLAQQLGFGMQNNYSSTNTIFSIPEGAFIPKNQATDLNFCFSEQASCSLHLILNNNQPLLNHMDRNELLKNIIRFYQVHVPGFTTLKSHDVLMEVFNSSMITNPSI
ncbi:MAG: DNA repair protein RecO [Flavobacteriales bacterium]|nr:DNA repair protein RecO [Flavobacteriales bacterium]